jgi:hypothetical protein
MRRRTASSIAHTIPETMPPTAICQTRICPENASAHNVAEFTAMTKSCVSSNRLRFSASPTTPAIVPMNSIGMLRVTVTRATKTVEWVTS